MNNSHTDNSVRPLALATAGEGVHDDIAHQIDFAYSGHDKIIEVDDSELEAKARELGISYNESYDESNDGCLFLDKVAVSGRSNPPEGYHLGDVYLKHELFDEAKKLEGKVNRYCVDEKGLEKRKLILDDALGEERKGWSKIKAIGRAVVYGPRENYEDRESYSCKQCEKYTDDMEKMKKRKDTLNVELEKITTGPIAGMDIMHKTILSYKSELRDIESGYSDVQKNAFDAYTKLVVFTNYCSRIGTELQRMAMGNPSKKFKMLRNSDQLI